MKRIKSVWLIFGIIGSLFIISCTSEDKNVLEGESLSLGAIIKTEKGELENFKLEGEDYKQNLSDKVILEYDKERKTYIYLSKGKHFVKWKNKNIEIKDSKYNNLNLSPLGEYIGYIVQDENENKLKVIRLKDEKEVELKSKVKISGNFFDFSNEDILIYYGVSEEGINGIFEYDLKTKEEKLLYKIEKGYIEFFKSLDDELIIFNNLIDSGKELKSINLKTKEVKHLSSDIEKLSDIEKIDENYYFLGNTITDNNSLYLLKQNNIERLIFDFPKFISLESKLSKTENKEILFMGKDNSNERVKIYKYNNDEVKVIEVKKGIYNFVEFD